jgi:hypothetical protein
MFTTEGREAHSEIISNVEAGVAQMPQLVKPQGHIPAI